MSNETKIIQLKSLKKLTTRIRDDLNNKDFVLLFAYNGTGKTRLSMAFKDAGKKRLQKNKVTSSGENKLTPSGESQIIEELTRDTLYFNAFTEDLFHWDNDLDGDAERVLQINSASRFFSGLKELALEDKIFSYFNRYSDLDFKIDYKKWTISFSKGENFNIKVSRGEENIFIWCIFLAICELVIDGDESYSWVKYIYIDDPISSLDDNNVIAVASDLAQLLKTGKDNIKTVISTHHALFFNVICNELHKIPHKKYFLYRGQESETYSLRNTDDTPFFHHVAMLSELKNAAETGKLYTHHFNMMRNILEKTSTFFGYKDFSACIYGIDDDVLYSRAVNLLSHGKYSIYEPKEMMTDTKVLLRKILNAFLERYKFDLPELLIDEPKEIIKT